MKTKINHLERLHSAMSIANIHPFQCKSSYPEYDAPRNLEGRTHYVDADTMKVFRSKILNAGFTKDGLLYWLVESVQSRPNHWEYNRRAVVFDVFGTIINERADMLETQGEWFKDTRKAEEAVFTFLNSFDTVKHTKDKLKKKMQENIKAARSTLQALTGVRKIS